MKYWECPNCKRQREYETPLSLKVCHNCQIEMEVIDGEKHANKKSF
jgi:hypothetical protein